MLSKLCRTKLNEILLSFDTMGTEKEMNVTSDVELARADVKTGETTKRGLKSRRVQLHMYGSKANMMVGYIL